MSSKGKNRIFKYAAGLVVDQFLALFATIIITNIFGFLFPHSSALIKLLSGVFAFGVICHVDSWGNGSSDRAKVKNGYISGNTAYGFLCGIVAIVPSLVLAFFAFLAEAHSVRFYSIFEKDIFTFINRIWQLPFSPLFVYVNKFPCLNFVLPMFVPIVSGAAYFLGFNGVTLKQLLLYKKDAE